MLLPSRSTPTPAKLAGLVELGAAVGHHAVAAVHGFDGHLRTFKQPKENEGNTKGEPKDTKTIFNPSLETDRKSTHLPPTIVQTKRETHLRSGLARTLGIETELGCPISDPPLKVTHF